MLNGEKVILRAMEPRDVDLLMEWENDPDHWDVSGTIAPYSRSSIESLVKQSELNIYQTGQLRLMISDTSDAATVGTIDLFDFDAFHHRAGVGILIALTNRRGRGLATESLRLLIDYTFNHLGLHQLYCNVLTDNTRSVELFKSAGFIITGERKEWVRVNGSYKNQYFMQLLNKRL